MNTVVIPCFNRADYLRLCLERIMQADCWSDYRYVFACDLGTTKEVYQEISNFPHSHKINVTPSVHKYKAGKQSHNVMNGLLSFPNDEAHLVFYIEDDVFIGKDFFTFSEDIHRQAHPFVTVMSRNMNASDAVCETDANAYYLKLSNEYQGIGVCFDNKVLRETLMPHFVPAYFMNITGYVKSVFPDSALSHFYAEQDGLIRRLIEKHKLSVAFTHLPRCFHAGFYGYHRKSNHQMNRLNLQQRCDYIRKVSFDVSELSKVVTDPYYLKDSFPVNLLTEHTDCYELPLKA